MKKHFFLSLLSFFTVVLNAQPTLMRVTNPSNPIVADGGQAGYAGASWVDYDNDGDADLFVNNDRLYRNDGAGQFTKITTTIGVGLVMDAVSIGHGNSWADYDNDGDLDCFVSSGYASNLYRNDGNGVFTKVRKGILQDSASINGWGCAWGDYDNDGKVDIAITFPNGFLPFSPSINRLLHNDGADNFSKITPVPIAEGNAPYTIGTWSDYDQDGDLDFFIGSGPADGTVIVDFLFKNRLKETGIASFQRITEGVIATDKQDGQVWNWIDYDNDGDFDAFLTNYRGNTNGLINRLYRNDNGQFTRIAGQTIVTDKANSLASVWGDMDNDGDLDCFVGNDGPTKPQFYNNNGNGIFTRIDTMDITQEAQTRCGMTLGDYDNDGRLDVFMIGPTSNWLYRNQSENGYKWLKIKCIGVQSNRAGIGTKVRIKATIDGASVWQIREISAQNSFLGQNALEAHFGLKNATHIDSLEVVWLSGRKDIYTNVQPNKFYTVREGQGIMTGTTQMEAEKGPLSIFPNPAKEALVLTGLEENTAINLLEIADMNGKVVFSSKKMIFQGKQMTLNLHPYKNGIYILTTKIGDNIYSKKFIIER